LEQKWLYGISPQILSILTKLSDMLIYLTAISKER